MKFSNDAARKRALTLRESGTYVEGRFFGVEAGHAALFARALAIEYGRDVQVVERFQPVLKSCCHNPRLRHGYAVVLATATPDGSVFT
jgi:hypothetical protein